MASGANTFSKEFYIPGVAMDSTAVQDELRAQRLSDDTINEASPSRSPYFRAAQADLRQPLGSILEVSPEASASGCERRSSGSRPPASPIRQPDFSTSDRGAERHSVAPGASWAGRGGASVRGSSLEVPVMRPIGQNVQPPLPRTLYLPQSMPTRGRPVQHQEPFYYRVQRSPSPTAWGPPPGRYEARSELRVSSPGLRVPAPPFAAHQRVVSPAYPGPVYFMNSRSTPASATGSVAVPPGSSARRHSPCQRFSSAAPVAPGTHRTPSPPAGVRRRVMAPGPHVHLGRQSSQLGSPPLPPVRVTRVRVESAFVIASPPVVPGLVGCFNVPLPRESRSSSPFSRNGLRVGVAFYLPTSAVSSAYGAAASVEASVRSLSPRLSRMHLASAPTQYTSLSVPSTARTIQSPSLLSSARSSTACGPLTYAPACHLGAPCSSPHVSNGHGQPIHRRVTYQINSSALRKTSETIVRVMTTQNPSNVVYCSGALFQGSRQSSIARQSSAAYSTARQCSVGSMVMSTAVRTSSRVASPSPRAAACTPTEEGNAAPEQRQWQGREASSYGPYASGCRTPQPMSPQSALESPANSPTDNDAMMVSFIMEKENEQRQDESEGNETRETRSDGEEWISSGRVTLPETLSYAEGLQPLARSF